MTDLVYQLLASRKRRIAARLRHDHQPSEVPMLAASNIHYELAGRDRGIAMGGILDADGTLAPTTGECKQGMDISYDGQWGYATQTPGGATVDFGEVDLNDLFENMMGGGRRGARRGGGGRGPFGGGGRAGGMPLEEEAARGPDITYPVNISFEQAMRGTTVEVRLNSPDRSIDETISVKIPPGVDDGAKVRVRGKGQLGQGGRGDLIIATHVEPHAYFKREGKDILLDLPISMSEAANGATVSVPTLDGRVDLRIPAGITSGKRLRIKERGLPQKAGGGPRGDQYCRILVQVPPGLTAEQKAQLAEMEKGFDPRKDVAW